MKGSLYKAPLFVLTLSLASWVFAANKAIEQTVQTKTKTLSSSAGCMGCHQGEAAAPVKENH